MASQSRLATAFSVGHIALPDSGLIALYRPPIDLDISLFPKSRLRIIEGFWPHHDHWEQQGLAVAPALDHIVGMAFVFAHRSRVLTRAMIADAVEKVSDGVICVDGQKTEGIDSLFKSVKKIAATATPALSKAHGKTFSFSGGDFSTWVAVEQTIDGGFVTSPGVFSADCIDKASALLAEELPADLKGRVADLGAGWGYLSSVVLKSAEVTECHVVEAEHAALSDARKNVKDARAVFHWADATHFSSEMLFDHVISNPPFHIGRQAQPEIGQEFISAAARILRPNGTLWLVANRQLPYESVLHASFRSVNELRLTNGFKVLKAELPTRRNVGR